MSVYVDPMMDCLAGVKWPWGEACHMFADLLGELHAFAQRLGLKRAWFQRGGGEGRVSGETVKIYVASSWRNERQQEIVAALRAAGHEVYDFRNPRPGDRGFAWSQVSPCWQSWTPAEFRRTLMGDRLCQEAYLQDIHTLDRCDVCVLVLPCGRSAHLEAGYAAGAGKKTVLLLADGEPELMYLMADFICLSLSEVVEVLEAVAMMMAGASAARRPKGMDLTCPVCFKAAIYEAPDDAVFNVVSCIHCGAAFDFEADDGQGEEAPL